MRLLIISYNPYKIIDLPANIPNIVWHVELFSMNEYLTILQVHIPHNDFVCCIYMAEWVHTFLYR